MMMANHLCVGGRDLLVKRSTHFFGPETIGSKWIISYCVKKSEGYLSLSGIRKIIQIMNTVRLFEEVQP